MGKETLRIPMRLFSDNRERLCSRLRSHGDVPRGAVVLLQGGEQQMRYCSDHEPVFRQVRRWHPEERGEGGKEQEGGREGRCMDILLHDP